MERFFSRLMSGWGKTFALIELGRPWNGISVALLGIIGAMLAVQAVPPLSLILITGGEIFIIYMAASMLNDFFDVKVDEINMPYRPIQRGKIRPGTALKASLLLYAAGLAISFFVSFNFFISMTLMAFLSVMYSSPPFKLEARGLLGNLILGVNTIFTSMYSGYVIAVNSLMLNPQFLVTTGLFTLSFICLNIIKDFKDTQGDMIYNKKTAAVRYGKRLLSAVIMGGAAMLLLTSFVINSYYFQNPAFLFISFLVFVFLMATDLSFYRNVSSQSGEIAWELTRISVLAFIISIFAFSMYTFI